MAKEQKSREKAIKAVLLLFFGYITLSLNAYANIPEWRAKSMQTVTFSADKDMDALAQTYPFLKETIQQAKDLEQKINDTSTHMRFAEVRDAKTNLFFLIKSGPLWCGSNGCPLTIYADDGTGYQKALETVTFEPIHLSRKGGKVSLYFNTLNSYTKWDLEDHKFVYQQPTDEPEQRRDALGRPIDEHGNVLKLDKNGNIIKPGPK